MKKLFLCFFGAVFCTANLFAADGVVISRSIPTKNVSQTQEISESHRNVVQRSGVENTRVATRNTKRTNAVSRKTKSDNTKVVSRSVNNQKSTNARTGLADAVNTVGRNARVDAASINNTAAVKRAGVVLRASTAEVGGRATIGNTGVQTGSNIDEQIKSKRNRASVLGSSKKDVAPTAESIANAKDILEKTADLNNTCQQQYNECMDQFCMVVDANQKRCSCSVNLAKYAKAQQAVEDANVELNEVAQNIRYVGLSANEIRAIFSATEAEQAMSKTKDTTQTRSLLDDIAEMIEDPSAASSFSSSDSGFSTMDMDLDFSSDSDLFSLDLFNNSKDISNKRGRDLYNEATKRCKTVLNACKDAGGTEKLITGNYDLAIDKDCIAYEQGLKKLNDTLLANVRSANLMLQKARLSVLQNKNQYDIKGCVGALEECMLDDMVCGEGYKKCLDPTKQFIDENGNVVLGRNITNITAFMQYYDNSKITPEYIKNVAKNTSCVKGDGDCIVNYLLKKIGTGATVQDGGLCRAVLDKCQDYTYTKLNKNFIYNPYNEVVVNYIQRAMVNIKSADSKIIADYAANCMNDVSECYNDQYSQINSWTTSANADSVYNIMKGSCYNVALTCGHAVFAYDKAMGDKMDAIAADTTLTKEQQTQKQNDALIDGISELFAQNMICPDNSTFVSEAHEPSENRTMTVERTTYKICGADTVVVSGKGICEPDDSICLPGYDYEGHCGSIRSPYCVYRSDLNSQYKCRASESLCNRITDKSSCDSSRTACKWAEGTKTLGDLFTASSKKEWETAVGKNEGGIAYVNAHCKCNKDYVVWNGACVKACDVGQYRTTAGTCKSCEEGYHVAGGDIAYTDWEDCNSGRVVTEYTKCEADATASGTSD